jgi:hypothetical protein
VAVVALVVVGLAASATYSALKAKHLMDEARTMVSEITASSHSVQSAQDRSHTRELIDRVDADITQAQHLLNTSPGILAMWVVPYLHSQRQAVINMLDDVHTVAQSGKKLLATLNELAATSHGTTIALPELRQLHAEIGAAQSQFGPMSHQPGGFLPLLPPVNHAVQAFDRQDARLVALLSDANQLSSYAMTFLGGRGPRDYLLVAENNAEMRDQGAVLSYALVGADSGTFQVGSTSSISNVSLDSPAPVPMSAGTQEVFGPWSPTWQWRSTNAPAAFPWSGRDMQAMYQQATGQHVDGVIALDVPGLSRLLELVGPVQVPGISQSITASNLSTVVLHDLYVGLPNSTQEQRRDDLAGVAKAVVDKMREGHVDVAAFANALAKDVAGRHLMAWDSLPANEVTIRKFGGSGAIDTQQPTRAFHVAVENASANKLDYYVTVSVAERVLITPSGDAQVLTSVTMKNSAPAGQAPSYQLGPDHVSTFTPGEYVGAVYLWGPSGSNQPSSVPESGLRVSQGTDILFPQDTGTVQFETTIPDAVRDGHLHLVFIPQPRLVPDQLSVQVQGQGWTIQGPRQVSATWSKTLSYTWNVSAS